MSKIEKAYAITDAKISFVSLVDKAANKKQFLITKAEIPPGRTTAPPLLLLTAESSTRMLIVTTSPALSMSPSQRTLTAIT